MVGIELTPFASGALTVPLCHLAPTLGLLDCTTAPLGPNIKTPPKKALILNSVLNEIIIQ